MKTNSKTPEHNSSSFSLFPYLYIKSLITYVFRRVPTCSTNTFALLIRNFLWCLLSWWRIGFECAKTRRVRDGEEVRVCVCERERERVRVESGETCLCMHQRFQTVLSCFVRRSEFWQNSWFLNKPFDCTFSFIQFLKVTVST